MWGAAGKLGWLDRLDRPGRLGRLGWLGWLGKLGRLTCTASLFQAVDRAGMVNTASASVWTVIVQCSVQCC